MTAKHISTSYRMPCVKMHNIGANMGNAAIFW